MIARTEFQPLDRLRGISRDTTHPFQHTAQKELDSMRAASSRFNVGALVTSGETGAASAAMDVGAQRYIPLTGFAPRGKFNETGVLKPQHAPLLVEPSDKFATISAAEAISESAAQAPYARRLLIQEAIDLNAPWFLNVVGARESLSETSNYSVYSRVRQLLEGTFRDGHPS